MLKVLVAVEDPIAQAGLCTLLGEADDIDVSCCNPASCHIPSAVEDHGPKVLLLDVKQRRADRELIPGLTKRFPDLRILVFVNHTAEECGIRHLLLDGGRAKLAPEALAMVDDCCLTSLRQKALGCLAMGTQPAGVLEAVRAVARGEVAAAPWLSAVASSLAAAGDANAIPPITPRELEVLALLAKGQSNKQIARNLEIREQTVKNHVGRLMEKLGVGSRLEAGLFAAEHHLQLVDEA